MSEVFLVSAVVMLTYEHIQKRMIYKKMILLQFKHVK